jgi:hypothetical protein
MIGHAWSVLCDKTLVDQDSQNISLDAVEQIAARGLPAAPPDSLLLLPFRPIIVSLWYRDLPDQPATGEARISFRAPTGVTLDTFDLVVDLTTAERCRTRLELPGLPVSTSGRYYFDVELRRQSEWAREARLPLQVVLEGR